MERKGTAGKGVRGLSGASGWMLTLPFAIMWLLVAWFQQGFIKGDEVELLDAALRAAGYSTFEPWVIRSTLLADLVGTLWLRPLMGLVRDPHRLLFLATVPAVAGATITMILLRRPGGAMTCDGTGSAAALLYGAHWIPLTFATAPFPRAFTTPLVMGSVLLTTKEGPWRAFFAGMLIGLAGASRYSEWIFIASIALLMLLQRFSIASLLRAGLGFLAGAALIVLYDDHAWGSAGSSLLAFVDYTFVLRESSSLVRHQPWYWYLRRMYEVISPPLWVFLALGFADRRARAIGLSFGVLPIVLLSAVHHKELRYLQAVIPVLLLVTARGIVIAWKGDRRRVYATLLLLGLLWSAAQFRHVAKRSAVPLEVAAASAPTKPQCVAFMQPWLYGNSLYFPNATRREIVLDASSVQVLGRARGCEHLFLFEENIVPASIVQLQSEGWRLIERRRIDESHTILSLAASVEKPPGN